MPYDPFKHHRRSIRLRGYDYTQAGAYFVTIVTCNRECLFGDVVDGAMHVNAFGQIVAECWDALPAHFPNVELDAFVVMPNHVHGIIVIVDDAAPRRGVVGAQNVGAHVGAQNVGAQHAAPLHAPPHGNINVIPGSLGAIVRSFKSATTKRINASRDTAGAPVWQRNYYEHIIRNEKSLHAIRAYIENNPAHWAQDEENPTRQTPYANHKEKTR